MSSGVVLQTLLDLLEDFVFSAALNGNVSQHPSQYCCIYIVQYILEYSSNAFLLREHRACMLEQLVVGYKSLL